MFAPRSASRVQTVMTWLQQCIMERRREGGLQVPAPLLTRMYQLLSDGMLGYEQCRCDPSSCHYRLAAQFSVLSIGSKLCWQRIFFVMVHHTLTKL